MRKALLGVVICGYGVLAAQAAHADLIGAALGASYQTPTLGTVYPGASWTPPSFVVGAGVETVGNVEGVTDLTTDFSASALRIVLTTVLRGPTWNAVPFNGPVFTSLAALGITGATVDPSTTMAGFDNSRISFTANEIQVNWSGLSYTDGTVVAVNFDFAAIPSPAAIALFGVGLLALCGARSSRL